MTQIAPVTFSRWMTTFSLMIRISFQTLLARKASWFAVLIFSACVLVLFPFAFGTEVIKQTEVRFGSFWMVQEFLVALVMARMFSAEQEAGALEFLLSSRAPRQAILFGKMVATVLQLLTLQLPVLVIWMALFNLHPSVFLATAQKVMAVTVFFNLGTAALGATLSCITARSLAKEVLFPVLFFPLQLTILLASVSICLRGESNLVLESISASAWWSFLILYPVCFTSLGLILGDDLLQE